ncbi:hypothetical protein DFH28DRAFT_883965 [Melampsora americana]|nr:hypothetical protein DFH28DRAFT_883965 [Melampsora americana]
MEKIIKEFYVGCLKMNILCYLVLLLSFNASLNFAFDSLSSSCLENKFSQKKNYHLWKSAGILDGIFPFSPEKDIQDDEWAGEKMAPSFTFFAHDMKTPNANKEHGSFEDHKIKDTIEHQDHSLWKPVEPSIDDNHYIQASEILLSYQQDRTAGESLKEIVKMKPSQYSDLTKYSEAQPIDSVGASQSLEEANVHLIEKDNLKEGVPSGLFLTMGKEIPEAQRGSRALVNSINDAYSKIDVVGKNIEPIYDQKLNQKAPHSLQMAEKGSSEQNISGPKVQVREPKKDSKVEGAPSSGIKSKIDNTGNSDTQVINSDKRRVKRLGGSSFNEKRRLVTQENSKQIQTKKNNAKEALLDVQGEKLIPENTNTHSKVISNKNPFDALNLYDALDPSKGSVTIAEQNNKCQSPSNKIHDNEEATIFKNSKADDPVVDSGKSDEYQILSQDGQGKLVNVEGDLSTGQTLPKDSQGGNNSGSEVDLEENREDDPKDDNMMSAKDGQRKKKTVQNKKGKKNNKTKKGKNNSVEKLFKPSISSFDAVAHAAIDSQVPSSDKRLSLTKEELFKLDVPSFLKKCLKFHDKSIYLPLSVSDVELEYLYTFGFSKGTETWGEYTQEFVKSFRNWREGTRRIVLLGEQCQEKLIVWQWNCVKNDLPEISQQFAKSLRADEEFPTFEGSSVEDYQRYCKQAKLLENQSPEVIQKTMGIFGDVLSRRVMTLDLMSQYHSNFLKEVFGSGDVAQGLDIPILISIDQSLDLGKIDYLTKLDSEDIQHRVTKLIDAMNGRVLSPSGSEYNKPNFYWVSEPTRYYMTKKNFRISDLFNARIKTLAKHADSLGVEVPERVADHIPEPISGLSLGEVLLCAHSGMKFEVLSEFKEAFPLLKNPITKRLQVIGVWSDVSAHLLVDAVRFKRYCDSRNCVVSGLKQFLERGKLEHIL